jgi:diketogulonate reductase-like aldo/keto reductase
MRLLDVPVIGQGTWNLEHDDEDEAVEALRAGIAAGMTHIDTAEMYGSGRVERLVGRAIAGRRHEVFLVSKVLPQNASYHDTIRACERSLERLGTAYLDVYLLHWRGRVPLAETFRAFEALESAGKIKAFGVSNFDVHDLEQAVAITGERRIACNQVLYHVAERSIEHSVIPWCRQHDMPVVAYSPLGSGTFPSPRSAGGKVLAATAEQRGLSPQQVALAFLVQHGRVLAIPKAANKKHVLENAAVGTIRLTAAELRGIDAAFPAKRKRGLAML